MSSPRPSDFTYAVNYSDADACYVVHVLDFPLLAAHGPTEQSALEEAVAVVEDVLEDMREAGEAAPRPWSARP